MNLTARVKNWLVKKEKVAATASDDEFKKALSECLLSGELSPEEFAELSKSTDDDEAENFASLMKGFQTTIDGLKSDIQELKKGGNGTSQDAKNTDSNSNGTDATKGGEGSTKTVASPLEKMVARLSSFDDIDAETGEEKSFSIRVKEAAEQYDTTKSVLTYPEATQSGKSHAFAGAPVRDFSDESSAGRVLESASERDKAIAGAFAKFLVGKCLYKTRSAAFANLPQHDKELLCYAMENEKWGGSGINNPDDRFADIKDRKLTPTEQKALIDDATSGGLEAAPIVFDDQVIQTPLLHGELFPLVTTVPLDRGRRVEGLSTGTVTSSWGGVDDSAISLFNTASYVSAFDTTIFRWEGAIRIGLDFLSDTPIDFGQHVTSQYGERMLEDLDDVIAAGNGTTQPEGVRNKSGATSVSFGGSTSLGGYESLRFGVSKAEHRANVARTAVFCGTETSYQRARAIPVGASDARRLGGTGGIGGVNDYGSYSWMNRPYKINESLTNQQIFYAVMARYRMYRRRGLTMRSSTEGDTLIRNNEMLLVAMARYGGQMERGACVAITTDAPS